MAREAALLTVAADAGVPVPGLVDHGPELLGSPYLIMERLDGETIPRRLLRDGRFAEVRPRLARELGTILARLHTIPPNTVPGLPDGDPLDDIATCYEGFAEARPTVELALRWLDRRRPAASADRSVVHGDFRNGNLMIDPSGIRGVLDWELATVGDPAEDLGWMCVKAWRFGAPDPVGGFGTRAALLEGYAAAGGTPPTLEALHWWEVYGTLRWTIRGILAVIGGEDQITVIPHLDAGLARADPKPFLGTSDNTNLHHWLWANGIASFYGGSSQVHLGPGPRVDDVHARSLRAALITGETLEISGPGESEDVGVDWGDPRALTCFGDREFAEPWSWHGPASSVAGRTWGGGLEVIEWILTAGRFPFGPDVLDGGVLLLETSEELLPARNVGWIIRSLGERGVLAAAGAVLLGRPPVSDFTRRPPAAERARLRAEQRDVAVELIGRYNPQAVVCAGIPFGHTRPQWILPHGGTITVDGVTRRVTADYS